ncbi:serine/threonine-protein kinase VRK1 [Cynoglossus semilaevis]|uniref:non-specific serine/threonine protein kinase n=1 Tax=Cynoglossus semilaevis TaxID=244447 RepID=A0A3P8UUK6_CYNSE|nr:serine/threonine-protein kinase VRK1 [Cynoglossus semilaevis]
MGPKAKVAGKARAPAKRKLAEEFPSGEVLTDTVKKSWKLGAPIGKGGFGLIYLANENSANAVGADARYVIKVEPSENGPLFSELKFYMRAAKPELIQNWMKSRKLKNLGVPRYWGSGLHEKGGKRYRFMVIDRLGTDLQKKFEECGKKFSRKVVLQLGLRLLDILEYIHDHEYVHADIKASNLMLSQGDPNLVYLVDYGLAYRFSPDGVHKEYKEDPKRCHDGTIELTSIDAHKGASPCRRSDLEILCYCMVQWLCGRLPWEDKLQDPLYVRDSKINCQENISQFMIKCFSTQNKPDEIQKFMEVVKSIGYQDRPPYDRLRSILQTGLKSIQSKDDGKLEFTPVNGTLSSPVKKTTRKRKADETSVADASEAKTKKEDVNGAKSPAKSPRKKKVPASRQTRVGTLRSPGATGRPRGRPKKTQA